MRFNRLIPENRLDHDPFPQLFENPSQKGLANAEHRWTKANPAQVRGPLDKGWVLK